MSIRHRVYIIDTSTGQIVYQNQVFGNNSYADKKFYNDINVKLDDEALLPITKIDYRTFLIAWHKYLNRFLDTKQYINDFKEKMEEKNDDRIIANLISYSWTYTGQLNLLFHDILKYTQDFRFDLLKSPYEIYIEIS